MVDQAVQVSQEAATVLEVRDLAIKYRGKTALENVSLDVREHEIFGIIGPANSGKTSFLKAINRMNEFNSSMRVDGTVKFLGKDTRKWRNSYALRRKVGVVFPLPVGLPLSVYDNVALSPRLSGLKNKADLDIIVERCLR
ncbi:MAG: ATP-binding cassette domain-containing protein, partial [Rhodothermales bacterium]|nr:ATP-binding cassette domain-containing protein [Rhodothermales bacterium]